MQGPTEAEIVARVEAGVTAGIGIGREAGDGTARVVVEGGTGAGSRSGTKAEVEHSIDTDCGAAMLLRMRSAVILSE